MAGRQRADGRQLARQTRIEVRRDAGADQRDARGLPGPVDDWRDELVEGARGELFGGERAADLAARRLVEPANRAGPFSLEPRDDQEIGIDGGQRSVGAGD